MNKTSAQVIPFQNDYAYTHGEKIEKIPDAKYELAFVSCETRLLHVSGKKLVVWYRLISPGKYNGIILARWYNVSRMIGQVGQSGGFKAGPKSDFTREWAAIFGSIPHRLDRFPVTNLSKVIVQGYTRVVQMDARRNPIPESAQYSVIDRITGKATG